MSQPTSEVNPDLYPIALPPDATSFQGISGKTYYVERKRNLSVARDRWLEKFGIHAMLGRDAMSWLIEARDVYDDLNRSRFVDAGVRLNNLITGASDLASKASPAYQVCTLFINEEHEDRRTYDFDYAQQKIADWQHIESGFFLGLALAYLNTTSTQLSELMQTFLGLNLPNLGIQNPGPSSTE